MKVRRGQASPAAAGLTRRELRAVESGLGVYLDKPVNASRTSNQQFGVYDEDEMHAGDICAMGEHFLEGELRAEIKRIFEK